MTRRMPAARKIPRWRSRYANCGSGAVSVLFWLNSLPPSGSRCPQRCYSTPGFGHPSEKGTEICPLRFADDAEATELAVRQPPAAFGELRVRLLPARLEVAAHIRDQPVEAV